MMDDLQAHLTEEELPQKCSRCDGTGSYRFDDGHGAGYTEPCEPFFWPHYEFMARRLAEARGLAELWGAELISAAVQLHAANCQSNSVSLKECKNVTCKRYLRALDVTPEEALARKRRAESSATERSTK